MATLFMRPDAVKGIRPGGTVINVNRFTVRLIHGQAKTLPLKNNHPLLPERLLRQGMDDLGTTSTTFGGRQSNLISRSLLILLRK